MKNESAAPLGRQGGNNIDHVHVDHCPVELEISIINRDLSAEDAAESAAFADAWDAQWQPWLDRVELRASRGRAGSSERALARAVAAMVPPSAAMFVPVPTLALVAGIGPYAARAALGRLVEKRLIRFEPGNGRGIRSVIEVRGPYGP